jgi:MGT family glycosyltransferase
MSRVLAYTSPARGHLYPIVPILLELKRRGHAVALRTLRSQVDLMRTLDIDTMSISEHIERIELDDWRKRSQPAKGRRALETFAARAEPEAADLLRAIDEQSPDVLLVDFNCWGAATVAEAYGRPWAMYCPYLLPLPSRDAPPFGLGLAPARGALGALRDALARPLVRAVTDQTTMPALSALRAEHGLPPLERFEQLLSRPPLLLALTAEGFEYPRSDWPANVRLVGAIDWDPPQEHPAWLAEMTDPLVLVTCSTEHQGDERIVRAALDALPAAGMSVIATTAAHDPDAFQAPPGSRVLRFLAHDAVLARSACVVCHGGMGITQKALAAEVPVVVVPFGRDQLETARRVEVAEAGVRLPPRRLTPARLLAAVNTAISRREGTRRVSRAFAAAGRQVAAADAIEEISRTPRSDSNGA